MSRPPKARRRILDGAYELLARAGVRGITLHGLAQASGVSRNAVLYHWPSRRDLVRELVRHDLDAWEQRCRAPEPTATAFAMRLHATLDARAGVGQLAASLVDEAKTDEATWAHVLATDRARFHGWPWDDADVGRYALLLAAEGAFWRRLNGIVPDVHGLDDRLAARLERWRCEVESVADTTPPSTRDMAWH